MIALINCFLLMIDCLTFKIKAEFQVALFRLNVLMPSEKLF